MTHTVATLARRSWMIAPCAALLVLALGCQSDAERGRYSPTGPAVGGVPKLGLSPDFVTLEVGASQQLQVSLLDVNGKPVDDPNVTWETSDAEIATVNAQGFVRAMAPGQTIVTASYGPDLAATAFILVLPPPDARRSR